MISIKYKEKIYAGNSTQQQEARHVHAGRHRDAVCAVRRLIIGGAVADVIAVSVVGFILLVVDFVLMPGLKILKPQEALVLTLFGKYIGTLKGEGFYYVNPFSSR